MFLDLQKSTASKYIRVNRENIKVFLMYVSLLKSSI